MIKRSRESPNNVTEYLFKNKASMYVKQNTMPQPQQEILPPPSYRKFYHLHLITSGVSGPHSHGSRDCQDCHVSSPESSHATGERMGSTWAPLTHALQVDLPGLWGPRREARDALPSKSLLGLLFPSPLVYIFWQFQVSGLSGTLYTIQGK